MHDDKTSAGTIIDDRFVLIRRLGQGGAGTVWLCDDQSLGCRVALKLVHPHLRDDKRALSRFELEAKVLADLDHPNIAHCHAYALDSFRPYLAIEYVEGHSLKQEIASRSADDRHFTTEFLLRLFRELVSAVGYAHGRGVLHRDLNAANVLLDTTGEEVSVRVVDFGVAKLLDGDVSRATTHGRIIGTPASIAPEQAVGEEIDSRADVFAIGVILFEMLTLRRAWVLDADLTRQRAYDGPIPHLSHNMPLELFDRILNSSRPDIRDERPELPAALATTVIRALEVWPDDRFDTVEELLSAVESSLDGFRLAEPEATLVLGHGRRRGSTVSAPADPTAPTEMTGIVPRRASSVLGARDFDTRAEMAPTPMIMDATTPVEASQVGQIRDTALLVDRTRQVPPPLASAPPRRSLMVVGSLLTAGAVVVALVLVMRPKEEVRPGAATATDERTTEPTAGPTATRSSSPPPSRPVAPVAPPTAPPVALRTDPNAARGRPIRKPAPSATPPPPVAPATSARYVELRRMLVAVRNDPTDSEAIKALVDRIRTAAAGVSDVAARRRIERYAVSSQHMADVEGLARALKELERANP